MPWRTPTLHAYLPFGNDDKKPANSKRHAFEYAGVLISHVYNNQYQKGIAVSRADDMVGVAFTY